jgi:hypothetical protein
MFADNRLTDGRTWYSRDPAGEIAGGVNVYRPYDGDPINLSDTSGLTTNSDTSFFDQWSHASKDEVLNPKSKFFIPWALGRSVVWELPPLILHTLNSGYSEFRDDMTAEAAHSDSTLMKATANTFKIGSYPVQALAVGDFEYAQFESSGMGTGVRWLTTAPRVARYAVPALRGTVYTATALKAGDMAYTVYQGNADTLTVNDFMDLGWGLYGSYHLSGGRAGPMNPLNWRLNVTGEVVDGQAALGANRLVRYVGPGTSEAQMTPSAYSVAFEMQLTSEQLGLRQEQHFQIANNVLQVARASDPALAQLVPAPKGWGRPPTDWTWQHATIEQANRRIGVMQLVPRVQHTPGSPYWSLFHPLPGGGGGYVQWAVPAGAPKR